MAPDDIPHQTIALVDSISQEASSHLGVLFLLQLDELTCSFKLVLEVGLFSTNAAPVDHPAVPFQGNERVHTL